MIDSKKYAKELAEFAKHSTTIIADAMDKFGSVPDLMPLRDLHHETKIAGPTYYVETYHESNWHLHESLQNAPEDSIVFVEPFRCHKRAIFGEIVMDYIMLKRKARGVVVNGYMRDVAGIISKGYPLWYLGNNPVGCRNIRVEKPSPEEMALELKDNRTYYDHPQNSICVADAAGVVIIPEHKIPAVYRHLHEIVLLEEIWMTCLDMGLSTYDTICRKVYEKGLLGTDSAQVQGLYRSYAELKEAAAERLGEIVSSAVKSGKKVPS